MTAERALSFGAAAQAYHEFRPDYPDDLVAHVRAYTRGPLHRAIEIGAGTGKATRAFVRHGITVHATDPDAEMLAVLRRALPETTAEQAALEQLAVDEPVDLVYAAAALHWTDPTQRWTRIADLLRPGGTFASFGGPTTLADPELRAAETAARIRFLESDDVPSPDGTPVDAEMQWPGTELTVSDLFENVRQVEIARRATQRRAAYVGLLSTVSAYRMLADGDRREVLRRIHDALPPQVEVVSDLTLHLARRVERPPSRGRR